MAKYVNADALWYKLKEQRDNNTGYSNGPAWNVGINQAISILNKMEPKDVIYWNDKTNTEAAKSK